ncbi:class III signal peptide-containing protein [Candidatus Micrarchaeota archaeon]|nr:class III signal peptide-containing protein [Candidatus Micrarchaeota archaeon]
MRRFPASARKGQVSIEMIIVIAAVLAVALILVVQMQKTAKEAGTKTAEESKKIMAAIDGTKLTPTATAPKGDIGDACNDDSDCKSTLQCSYNTCI